MIERLEWTMGVKVFLMAGYRDKKGQVIESWYVLLLTILTILMVVRRFESEPKHGKRFTTSYPEWKEGTYSMFGEYLHQQYRKHIYHYYSLLLMTLPSK